MSILTNFLDKVTGRAEYKAKLNDLYNSTKSDSKAPLSKQLEHQSWVYRNKEIKDWKNALQMAKSIENPTREYLHDVYDNLLYDTHLSAACENRILPILRNSFGLYNSAGVIDEEKTKLLEAPWFRQFLRAAMWSFFRGHSVIELSQVKFGDLNSSIRAIPYSHVKPELGIVVKWTTDMEGWPYKEEPLANYYIPVQDVHFLGELEGVAPSVFAKKYAISSWTDFVEKFGIPPRHIKTKSTDSKRLGELLTMLSNQISSSVAVIKDDEELVISEPRASDPYKVFQELIRTMNSEISKKILGQDATMDNQANSGTYGSLQVLEGVGEDRNYADKMFIRDLINIQLIPRLINMGFPFNGLEFDWDDTTDLTPNELIDAVAKLAVHFELDYEQITERTGLNILGPKMAQATEPKPPTAAPNLPKL